MPGIKAQRKRVTGNLNTAQQWRAQLDDHVNSLVWSPDGQWLAAASVSGPITIFDGKTGQVRHTLIGHRFGTSEIAWNDAGTLLASAGQDGKVRLWDRESGEIRQEFEGGSAWVEHLAWVPGGDLLASAAGRSLRVWNAATSQMVQEYPPHSGTIYDVQWQPHAPLLISAAYGGMHFWLPDSTNLVRSLTWKGSILVIACSPDGRYIATGDQDSTVHFWMVQTGQDLQMYGYPTKVRELSWDGTSRYLATGGSDVVTVWDCSGKGPAGSKPIELAGHDAFISALAFAHRGLLIATASADGRLIFWQIGKQKQPHPLVQAAFDSSISQLTWSPDDRLLALGTESGLVTVCSTPTV
ncbi:MAG TPA: WD40 repeat domain-containing protein [Ktedonobacteraceae bacterium]|jgi:WD40 repeat protein|nr:WD40 repeat domain-containing protein [Ktedonobacteraceae bacterium]